MSTELTETSTSHTSSFKPTNHPNDEIQYRPFDLAKCPRRFSGSSGEDVTVFLEEVKLYIAVKRIPAEKALPQLKHLLKGKAAEWWRSVGGTIRSWDEAVIALREEYHDEKSQVDLFSELLNRRQEPNERAIDYLTSITSIMRQIKPLLQESLCKDFIISGLNPFVAAEIITKEKLSLLNLTSEIIRIEAVRKLISKNN